MTKLPKVTVRRSGCGWVAICDRGDFTYWHLLRFVVDESALEHSNHAHTKGAPD